MGKTVTAETSAPMRTDHLVVGNREFSDPGDPQNAYERYSKEKLNVLYLKSDSDVREAASLVRKMNPGVLSLDLETSSKSGHFGALNGALDGHIRLIQIGLDEPEKGIDPLQIVIDCHHADPKAFLPLLRTPRIEKAIHYSNFEQAWCLTHLGVSIGSIYDTCAADRVIQKKLWDVVKDVGLPEMQAIDPDWKPKRYPSQEDDYDREMREQMEEIGLPAAQSIVPGWTRTNSTLATITEKYLGLELPKDDQDSDWGRGKINSSQLTYAAMDVAILPDLARKVKDAANMVGCEDEIDQRIANLKHSVVKQVAKAESKQDDDSERIRKALLRSRTKAEIDAVFASSRQMTVRAKAKDPLRELYREKRAELPR